MFEKIPPRSFFTYFIPSQLFLNLAVNCVESEAENIFSKIEFLPFLLAYRGNYIKGPNKVGNLFTIEAGKN